MMTATTMAAFCVTSWKVFSHFVAVVAAAKVFKHVRTVGPRRAYVHVCVFVCVDVALGRQRPPAASLSPNVSKYLSCCVSVSVSVSYAEMDSYFATGLLVSNSVWPRAPKSVSLSWHSLALGDSFAFCFSISAHILSLSLAPALYSLNKATQCRQKEKIVYRTKVLLMACRCQRSVRRQVE